MDYREWKAHEARSNAEHLLASLEADEAALRAVTPEALAAEYEARLRQSASQLQTQAAALLRATEVAETAGVSAEHTKPLRAAHDEAQATASARLAELEK
jgi:hypothetical protein